MMSHEMKRRRKSVLIQPTFQVRALARLGLILAADFVLFLALVVATPVAIGWVTGTTNWGVLESMQRLDLLTVGFLLPMLCTMVCLLGQGLSWSFRIAGPLFRFEQILHDLQRLRIPRGVTIRRSDYLQETAAVFDETLECLHREVATLQSASTNAVQQLEEAGAAGDERLTKAYQAARDLNTRLSRFTLMGVAPAHAPPASDAPDKEHPSDAVHATEAVEPLVREEALV